MRIFHIFCILTALFLFSCGDDNTVTSNIPQITSVPEKVTLAYYPWDENSEGSVSDIITTEFEIFNKGKKELEISQINFLDPDGKLIKDSKNSNLKNLFKIQILKTKSGIITDEWNENSLDFSNKNSELSALCPVESLYADTKKCSEGFDPANYNSYFKIRLNYSKEDATSDISGDFQIEICSNDPMKSNSETCPEDSGSFKILVRRLPAPPPKPIIHVTFDFTTGGPMSYRNIKDEVSMNLKNTCVSDPDDSSKCLENWEEKYYIKYKWEMIESPTPLRDESRIKLPDSTGSAGQWLADLGNDSPKRAQFTGLMVTPKRYTDANPDFDEEKCSSECGEEPTNIEDKFYFMDLSNYLICRQKYCKKTRTRYYKVNIQAETVDRETDLVSITEEITVVPKIIPQARVVAQLTWVEGYKTKTESESSSIEGTKIDLDIHLIKKSSLEASVHNYTPIEGVMCTSQQYEGFNYPPTEDLDGDGKPDYEKYFRHDDCSYADQGADVVQDVSETINWHATFDLDNRWGGNNYENPETIGLGPIEDKDGDGKPDKQIIDDQYLVIVGYSYCSPQNFADSTWNTCCNPEEPDCNGDGSAYEVNARVDILVDGVEATRPERTQSGTVIRPADNYSETSKLFKIRPGEWKVIAAIKWDGTLPGPETNPSYTGDAIVSDKAMTDEEIEINTSSYKTCKFNISFCELVPIWDEEAYYEWVDQPMNPGDNESDSIGECY